jgi:diadenosine tetraphosphate (Ap4A) HIT family hydrolase
MKTCQICLAIKNGFFEFENKIGVKDSLSLKNRILIETKNFIVFPTIGAFSEGYLLIASKKHYRALGAMPIAYYQELNTLIELVKQTLRKEYQLPTILFENGSAPGVVKGVNTVDHLHVHIIPIKQDIGRQLTKVYEQVNLNNINTLNQLYKSGKSYYFYQNNLGENFAYVISGIPKSQYIRQLITKNMNTPEKWNWKEFYGINELAKTTKKLKKKLKSITI